MSLGHTDPDGSQLLTGEGVGELLRAAVEHAGGTLVTWSLDHVDANPQHSTTATYSAVVDWKFGRRDELLGVSARAQGRGRNDDRAEIFADGDREVAVWLYPKDPDLPGLPRATYVEDMTATLNRHRVMPGPVVPEDVELEMIGYRPRRRAVLRVSVPKYRTTVFVKVLRRRQFHEVVQRHELLLAAGIPAPTLAATTSDYLLIMRELPGRVLARSIFDPTPPCTAEQLIGVLDAMPPAVAGLERRPPWTDAVAHYAEMVIQAMPQLERQLHWMVDQISDGLRLIPPGNEPTHGDFHEGQVFTAGGRIVGLLDVDTVGPGRRADDLACLIAHLSTVQRMNAEQASRVQHLLRTWVPVFDERVDPTELRLRAAAVVISLSTGPFRGQEPDWQNQTAQIVNAAEALVRQVV
ncbi:aminoglycoside phosphotransferase family protein [Parenemella sanctibonifatiensis]|uniref:Phosphotransferase n=1 Tax=Parenemella sanctibonifatiensis TaxID=2016505 RepID=A0A255EVP8_9ACTN|nr:phosphotransferase [Parenemella sanctibonifatiensis]OYN92213.1 phosphotransferase [Parenemella sanctibonifatiensis]